MTDEKIIFKSYKEILDTSIEAIVEAYKQCPDAENKTFEEVAEWAGQHVLLTEKELVKND